MLTRSLVAVVTALCCCGGVASASASGATNNNNNNNNIVHRSSNQRKYDSVSNYDTTQLKDASEFLVTELQDIEPLFQNYDGRMYSGLMPFDYNVTTIVSTSTTSASAASASAPQGQQQRKEQRRAGEIMFWLFVPNDTNPGMDNDYSSSVVSNNKLVMWLNGGPGCSSFDAGIMFETGVVSSPPHDAGYCCGDPNEALVYNEYGWANYANMLYVEQPIETGYSYGLAGTKPPTNELEVSLDMYYFLQNLRRRRNALR